MNKYLEKIAETAEDTVGWGRSYLGAMGAGIVSNLLSRPLMKATANAVLGMHTSSNNQIGDGSTEREFLKKHNLNIEVIKNHPLPPQMSYGNIRGNLNKNIVYGSNNHGIHMHELGHALDLKNGNIVKHHLVNTGAGFLGGALAVKGIHDNDNTEIIAGTYLGSSPVLKREAMANIHAFNAFKKYEGKTTANKFLRRVVLPNTINYHTPTILGAAALVGAAHLLHKRNNK
jgi:hypothetical protein